MLFATREAEAGNARVKRMSDGEQFDVPIDGLADWLAERVGGAAPAAAPAAAAPPGGAGGAASSDRDKQIDALLEKVGGLDGDVVDGFLSSSNKLMDSLEGLRKSE